jgi:hypothetical protein
LISESGSQFRVGQRITYQLTPCNVPLANTQLLVISDTLSHGLTGLRIANRSWQIIANQTFSNGSTSILAVYTGSLTTAGRGTLPPLTFSGQLTAADSPFVTSLAAVAALAGSGSVGPPPPGSSGSSGPIGVSLNANVTGWAVAVDILPVVPTKL